ncbi:unnamed protein product, partial [Polarella glacialis]
ERRGLEAGVCKAPPAGALTWRAKPYDKPEGRTWKTYGGDLVTSTFSEPGFEGPVEGDDWDLLFTHFPMDLDAAQTAASTRSGGRLVNHCSYFRAAGQKCLLAKHVQQVREVLGASRTSASQSDLAWSLQTFHMKYSGNVTAWQLAMAEEPERLWVVKECASGRLRALLVFRFSQKLLRSWVPV